MKCNKLLSARSVKAKSCMQGQSSVRMVCLFSSRILPWNLFQKWLSHHEEVKQLHRQNIPWAAAFQRAPNSSPTWLILGWIITFSAQYWIHMERLSLCSSCNSWLETVESGNRIMNVTNCNKRLSEPERDRSPRAAMKALRANLNFFWRRRFCNKV